MMMMMNRACLHGRNFYISLIVIMIVNSGLAIFLVPQKLTSLCAKHHHQVLIFCLRMGKTDCQNCLIFITCEQLSMSFAPLLLLC